MLAACSGGSDSKSTPTAATRTAASTAAPSFSATTASPTAQPTANAPISTVDGQLVYEHVRKLAAEIGPRVAGTDGEIKARDYLKTTLEGYGYDVTIQDFGFDATAFLPARIDVSPAPGGSPGTSTPAIALRGSGSGSVAGNLVAAGIGRPEDFPPAGTTGHVALIERGDLTFAQKVGNAIAAGATAVIIYNDVPERGVFALDDTVTIPVVSIDQSAGQDLVAKIAAAPQDASVTVSPPKGTAYNVIAKPMGVTECDTITGGHYDSVPVTGGADDNAAGTASVLEVARVVAAKKLTAHHCFALFSAEEFGLFGSKDYVANLSDADKASLHGMVNLDVVGTSSGLDLIGSADLIDVARIAAEGLGIETRVSSLPPNTGSDHLSFLNAGIPVVMLYRDDRLIHTPEDAIDRILPTSLAETVEVALGTLQSLAPN